MTLRGVIFRPREPRLRLRCRLEGSWALPVTRLLLRAAV
jgi:hypothetical protein